MARRVAPPSAFHGIARERISVRTQRFRRRNHRCRDLAGKPVGQKLFSLRCTRRPAVSLEAGRPSYATGSPAMKYEVKLTSSSSGEQNRVIELERDASGWRVTLDGRPVAVDAVEIAPYTLSILLDGQSFEINVMPSLEGKLKLQTGTQEFTAEVIDPRAWSGRRHGSVEAEGRQQVVAPMPGKVVRVLV